MTYLELYEDALRKLHNSLITLGEFEMMIKPMNREVEVEPKTGKWIEEYNGNGWNDFWDYTCSNCGKKYERADVLYHANYCPNCGAKMK